MGGQLVVVALAVAEGVAMIAAAAGSGSALLGAGAAGLELEAPVDGLWRCWMSQWREIRRESIE